MVSNCAGRCCPMPHCPGQQCPGHVRFATMIMLCIIQPWLVHVNCFVPAACQTKTQTAVTYGINCNVLIWDINTCMIPTCILYLNCGHARALRVEPLNIYVCLTRTQSVLLLLVYSGDAISGCLLLLTSNGFALLCFLRSFQSSDQHFNLQVSMVATAILSCTISRLAKGDFQYLYSPFSHASILDHPKNITSIVIVNPLIMYQMADCYPHLMSLTTKLGSLSVIMPAAPHHQILFSGF